MILNNVKRLLQVEINDYSKDKFLSTIIELTLAKVKALCNISSDNLEVLTDYDNGVISTDALNIILKTVFDYLNKGNEFDFTILSELINQRLVIRNL